MAFQFLVPSLGKAGQHLAWGGFPVSPSQPLPSLGCREQEEEPCMLPCIVFPFLAFSPSFSLVFPFVSQGSKLRSLPSVGGTFQEHFVWKQISGSSSLVYILSMLTFILSVQTNLDNFLYGSFTA